jgi:hypothetical protein
MDTAGDRIRCSSVVYIRSVTGRDLHEFRFVAQVVPAGRQASRYAAGQLVPQAAAREIGSAGEWSGTRTTLRYSRWWWRTDRAAQDKRLCAGQDFVESEADGLVEAERHAAGVGPFELLIA